MPSPVAHELCSAASPSLDPSAWPLPLDPAGSAAVKGGESPGSPTPSLETSRSLHGSRRANSSPTQPMGPTGWPVRGSGAQRWVSEEPRQQEGTSTVNPARRSCTRFSDALFTPTQVPTAQVESDCPSGDGLVCLPRDACDLLLNCSKVHVHCKRLLHLLPSVATPFLGHPLPALHTQLRQRTSRRHDNSVPAQIGPGT